MLAMLDESEMEMRLRNDGTGDVLEVPPPNGFGESVIIFNGRVVERVLYSDEDGGWITLGDGMAFRAGMGFAEYLVEQLRIGAYRQ